MANLVKSGKAFLVTASEELKTFFIQKPFSYTILVGLFGGSIVFLLFSPPIALLLFTSFGFLLKGIQQNRVWIAFLAIIGMVISVTPMLIGVAASNFIACIYGSFIAGFTASQVANNWSKIDKFCSKQYIKMLKFILNLLD